MHRTISLNVVIRAMAAALVLATVSHWKIALAQAVDDLVGSWLVVVEGEPRARALIVQSVEQKPDGTAALIGQYGFVDGQKGRVTADLTGSGVARKLVLVTTANSVIVATQSAEGTFGGTITYKSGEVKPVKLNKTTEAALAASKRPAAEKELPSDAFFANEEKDFGVSPTRTPKRSPYHGATPKEIPGAKVISTVELKRQLDSDPTLVVIDVLDTTNGERRTVPGAVWMPGAGVGDFNGQQKSKFLATLGKLTTGDKARRIVFMCVNVECWLSYNASLHALDAGYTSVHWYRGGSAAWTAAKLKVDRITSAAW